MPNIVRKSHKQSEADVFIVAGKLYVFSKWRLIERTQTFNNEMQIAWKRVIRLVIIVFDGMKKSNVFTFFRAQQTSFIDKLPSKN